MKLKSENYEFAKTILKYYSPHFVKKKQQNTSTQNIEDEKTINQEKMDVKTKYSLDYEKFQNYLDPSDKQKQITPEEDEMNKIINSNPYLQQIACTHDRRKERELFERSTQEKLDNASYFKEQGNKSLKEKEYDKASYFYQKALIHFDYTFPENEKEQERFDLLKEQCHSNMALCKFYQKDYDESLQQCQQALKINIKNIKALFRIAKIYESRDQFQECEQAIKSLDEIDPQNLDVLQLKKDLQKKKDDYEKNSIKVYQRIFQQ